MKRSDETLFEAEEAAAGTIAFHSGMRGRLGAVRTARVAVLLHTEMRTTDRNFASPFMATWLLVSSLSILASRDSVDFWRLCDEALVRAGEGGHLGYGPDESPPTDLLSLMVSVAMYCRADGISLGRILPSVRRAMDRHPTPQKAIA